MNIKPIVKSIIAFGKKHSTKFLAGGAIVTEIFGFYLMHKEAPVVRQKLDALPPDSKLLDKVKVAAPVYLPAMLMLATSSGCIIGGCALGEARLAAMTNLAMASEATLARYEQKVIDTIGQDKANEIQEEIAKDLMHERPAEAKDVIATANGSDIFYDTLSGRYFTSCEKFILDAKDRINNRIDGIEMWVEVNDWYSELDIPSIPLGKGRGWNIDRKLSIELGEWESMPDGRPCRPIVYFNTPVLYNGHEPRNY